MVSGAPVVNCSTGSSQPTEIVTLAAALKCDPDLIFEYVCNNIEYEPLFGSNKGSLGTLLDQRGDDLDQVQLMGALLNAVGFSSAQFNYYYGYIRLTGAQMSSWLDVKNDGRAMGSLIVDGGIPYQNFTFNSDGTLNYGDVAHVWMTVQIGGTLYAFDPSFKQHGASTGLSTPASTMGYTQSQFLTDAGGIIGSVSGANISISSIDRSHDGSLRMLPMSFNDSGRAILSAAAHAPYIATASAAAPPGMPNDETRSLTHDIRHLLLRD
jgi:hypothetical protein